MPEDILLSVVMPTHNDAEYLRQAIDSILSQTFSQFEFIIVNDGSTDDTEEIIRSYSDSRIRYFANEVNMGNAYTRNVGMSKARGRYIAIMDSDDISPPDRFKLQMQFLEKHPDIDILGGAVEFFDEKVSYIKQFPSNPEYTKAFLFFKNAMFQPAVMLRREAWEKYKLAYDPARENMEDYDLWFKAAMAGAKLCSMEQVLLKYRISESQLSHTSNLEGRNKMLKYFFKERLTLFQISIPEDEFNLLHAFIRGRITVNKERHSLLKDNLYKLEKANKQYKVFDHTAFRAALFYFRLRLIKYYYWEQGRRVVFLSRLFSFMLRTGPKAIMLFWKNERHNLLNSNKAGF